MSTLLSDVPEDVLRDIITLVLLAERKPPPDLATASQRRVLDTHWPSFQPRGVVGRFEDVPYCANDLALKLANRRLSSITAQVLSHLRDSGRLIYVLDVAIVHEQELWPTWLCVPSLTITNLEIRVQFRLLGARKRDALSALHFNASPRVILYGFYYLLEHLLRRGPLLRPASLPNRLISAKTLQFIFLDTSPDAGQLGDLVTTRNDWLQFNDRHCDNEIPPDVVQVLPRAEWFGDLFMEHLEPMLNMGYYHAQYGAILHERVDTIAEYHVGDYFGGLSFEHTGETFGHVAREIRLQTFWKWKMDTVALRRQLGLPISEPIAMPPEGLLESALTGEPAGSTEDPSSSTPRGLRTRLSRLRDRARKLLRLGLSRTVER